MPKGKTTLYFNGGPNDGDSFVDVPGTRVFPLLSIPTGSGFTEEPEGHIGVFVEAPELPANWVTFKTARYARQDPKPGREGVHYDFVEEALITRCRAVTKQNEWCKNEAIAGQKICKTHSRSKELNLKPD
ncbi:hypothetical protein [Pseudomonas sp. Marseille-Q5115]|uniref:hypothetical protein n=1 Tax=Pseudomonas sp. Marseille-Q5115 TaxID=2866593 RepID=UPI001CE47926|nr:hypothetical protein [Pseudomonas sp. Marseille-Q5115]